MYVIVRIFVCKIPSSIAVTLYVTIYLFLTKVTSNQKKTIIKDFHQTENPQVNVNYYFQNNKKNLHVLF